jgi:hypothetical protein
MKSNSTGYPSAMFLGVECACNSHDIADLFARYFQKDYVYDVSVENADGYVFDEGSDDASGLSLIQFTEDDVGGCFDDGPDGISSFLGVKAPPNIIFSPSLASGVFFVLWLFRNIRPMVSEAQHGFDKGCSTVINLMQFSNFVIGKMEEGWHMNAVYTDFSKAFDWVNHRNYFSVC